MLRAEANALLPAAPFGRPLPEPFGDIWARRVIDAMVSAGDLEGALTLMNRDRSTVTFGSFAPGAVLLTFAEGREHPALVRGRALEVASRVSLDDEPGLIGRVAALLRDDAAVVRIGAAKLLVSRLDDDSSDRAQRRRMKAQAAEARRALINRFAVETDVRVLEALAFNGVSGQIKKSQPAFGAALRVEGGTLVLSVVCLTKQELGEPRVWARADGEAVPLELGSVQLLCGSGGRGWTEGHAPTQLAPGRYALGLEGRAAGVVTQWALGSLVVGSDASWTLE